MTDLLRAARDRPRPRPPRRPAQGHAAPRPTPSRRRSTTPAYLPPGAGHDRPRPDHRRSTPSAAEALDGVLAVAHHPQRRAAGLHRGRRARRAADRRGRLPRPARRRRGRRDLRGRPRRPPTSSGSTTTSSRTTSSCRADRADLYAPEKVNPAFPTDTERGRRRRRRWRSAPRHRRRRPTRTADVAQQPDGAARHDGAVGRAGDGLRSRCGTPPRACTRPAPRSRDVFGLETEQVRVICPVRRRRLRLQGHAARQRRARRDGRPRACPAGR